MNPEMITGTIRQWLPYASGIATALGLTWFDGVASTILSLSGPAGFLISWIWSMSNKTEGNILTMAANVPGVARIEMFDSERGRALAAPGVTPPKVQVAPVMRSASGHV